MTKDRYKYICLTLSVICKELEDKGQENKALSLLKVITCRGELCLFRKFEKMEGRTRPFNFYYYYFFIIIVAFFNFFFSKEQSY